MPNPQQYEVPTWNQTYEMLLCQTQKIRQTFQPDLIVAICRGGLVPARILSDLLENPNIATIQIKYYVGIAKTENIPELKQPVTGSVEGKKVLLVDDISDSGESLKLAKTHLIEQGAKEVKIATLYHKQTSITTPDYFEKQTNNWIVFPWDTKEAIREIIQTNQSSRAVKAEIGKLIKAGLPKHLTEKLLSDM
ncbi:MAG: phosphoribosyltransferase [Candidatus Bathyarchaeota archaeon]|nr:phosphoribosyltransferase [Candidatus Bathyarchaeota archaeon]